MWGKQDIVPGYLLTICSATVIFYWQIITLNKTASQIYICPIYILLELKSLNFYSLGDVSFKSEQNL